MITLKFKQKHKKNPDWFVFDTKINGTPEENSASNNDEWATNEDCRNDYDDHDEQMVIDRE